MAVKVESHNAQAHLQVPAATTAGTITKTDGSFWDLSITGSENESEIPGFNFAALKRPLVMGVVCFGGV